MIHIVENFFDDLELIESDIKKIKLYNADDFNNLFKTQQTWPGYRSNFLINENIFLHALFLKEFKSKFNYQDNFHLDLHVHLRLGNDQTKDFIHTDFPKKYTCIVYLNNNTDSGTNFYDGISDIPLVSVKSIKNRCVFFDSRIRHGSILNYGNDINDGRLTINGFIE
jgi:hypothetical protein